MRSDDLLVVLITAPAGLAGTLAHSLVEERLAACVNRLPVTSTYRWQGRIETDEEQLLLVKTSRATWPRLVARVRELHEYEVPELVGLSAAAVEASYLAWTLAACAPVTTTEAGGC